jgi:hypothetical protein
MLQRILVVTRGAMASRESDDNVPRVVPRLVEPLEEVRRGCRMFCLRDCGRIGRGAH